MYRHLTGLPLSEAARAKQQEHLLSRLVPLHPEVKEVDVPVLVCGVQHVEKGVDDNAHHHATHATVSEQRERGAHRVSTSRTLVQSPWPRRSMDTWKEAWAR